MFIEVEDHKFTEEQIKKGFHRQYALTETNAHALDFVHSWLKGEKEYIFHSSGSTSKPKEIVLSKEVLLYSAQQTLAYLGLSPSKKGKFLLCISPDFIGGKMVLIRAMIAGFDVDIIPANSDFSQLDSHYTLTSMVPLQVEKILKTRPALLEMFDHILIGGAPIHPSIEQQLSLIPTNFYHTYGMTETASHVALRKIPGQTFVAIGDAQFQTTAGNLRITGSVTNHKWLQTHDHVELINNQEFRWLRRADFIINSGGIKIDPEKIETVLKNQFTKPFAISSLPDDKLGKIMILASEEPEKSLDLSELHPYERPKRIFWSRSIPMTASGKIDRLALAKIVQDEIH